MRRDFLWEDEAILIAHEMVGSGAPAIVFVHGFGCARDDWAAQVTVLAPRHATVALDLPAHGESAGEAADCTIEFFGASVVALLQALGLRDAVLVGHSMGCRVVVEAALQAPLTTSGLVLVDGSQFAAPMQASLEAAFASDEGYAAVVAAMFAQMFNQRSDSARKAAIIARAARLAPAAGMRALGDMVRYDVAKLEASLSTLKVPVLALQSTYTNERRERCSLDIGATTPYLDMLARSVANLTVEILPGLGHFPQIDAPAATTAAISRFAERLVRG